MRPVNLLPPGERPQKAVKAPANASALVLASLALLVLAMGFFVLTKNQITDRRAEIAQAKQRTSEATQRAAALKSFADFRQVKQTREASVKSLATQRFDWERFMRELSLVLPDKVWLKDLTGATGAAAAATAGGASSSAASSSASSSSSTTSGSAPSVKLSGCAPTQKAVATTLVRLRTLNAVDDVTLQDSTKGTAGSSSGSAPQSSGATSGSGATCTSFAFDVTVTFSSQAAQSAPTQRVPRRLGGGA